MTLNIEKLKSFGGKLKSDKRNRTIIAFGSSDVEQCALQLLSEQNDSTSFLFYFCTFKNVDFSILENSNLEELSILHGNFGDRELNQLSNIQTLRTLKIYDTKVTNDAIEVFKLNAPLVNLI